MRRGDKDLEAVLPLLEKMGKAVTKYTSDRLNILFKVEIKGHASALGIFITAGDPDLIPRSKLWRVYRKRELI